MSETWVINESPYASSTYSLTFETNINFTSNNTSYTKISRISDRYNFGYRLDYDNTRVCYDIDGDFMGWTDQAYRTVTFETPPTGELLTWLQSNAVKQEVQIDVSNKTYLIKQAPSFSNELLIHGNFTSGDEHFTQISVMDYENDWEIWYTNTNGSVLAYSNGVWEIEYRHITFDNNESLSETDYNNLLTIYEEYAPSVTKQFYVNNKLLELNGKRKGHITCKDRNGNILWEYDWDNGGTQLPTPSNVEISNTTITFDDVTGVESYEIFANGTSIGEYAV